jgi:hypothetical protein
MTSPTSSAPRSPLLYLPAALTCAWALVACVAAAPDGADDGSSASSVGKLEQVPAGEADGIKSITATITKSVQDDYAAQPADGKVAHRDAHAKHHGCVKAKFDVNPTLPAALTSTVFKAGASYDAWIRYSNGAGKPAKDQDGDGRGMAVKLVGVGGKKLLGGPAADFVTQDFLMINHPVFFVRNVADYDVFQTDIATTGNPIRYFIPSANPLKWRVHEALIGQAIRTKKLDNPLHAQYFSMAPYLFGTKAVKWSARPCESYDPPKDLPASPNYLREAMVDTLASGDACYEFLVQTQTNAADMPVEDPTIEWKESASPYVKVATITIPRQTFDSKEQMDFCENLSFTPWHAVPEHRPLGGINRARKVVYETISQVRHDLNGVTRVEPTDMSVPGLP